MAEARIEKIVLAIAFLMSVPAFADSPFFNPRNLVVAVEGCGLHGGSCTTVPNRTQAPVSINSSAGGYGDNQAAPLTLFQYNAQRHRERRVRGLSRCHKQVLALESLSGQKPIQPTHSHLADTRNNQNT